LSWDELARDNRYRAGVEVIERMRDNST